MIKTKELSNFPENANPYHHDSFNMGVRIAKNVHIMMPSHETQRVGIFYIVNIETGERLQVQVIPDDEIGGLGLAMDKE